MCPLRIILVFLSAALAGFLVFRSLKSSTVSEKDVSPSSIDEENDSKIIAPSSSSFKSFMFIHYTKFHTFQRSNWNFELGETKKREVMRRRKGPKEIIPESENGTFDVDGEGMKGPRFFACYLLTSLSPRFKGHTYIGFTVNPRRRIRQHNGEIASGAWRTKKKRPWEMVLCIYGFPTNVTALQFEWAWQHPVESLAVRKAAAELKSLSGIANKIKLAFTMLTLPEWNSLSLVVNFFSTKYKNHASCCQPLPQQMRTQVRLMEELPCYNGSDVFGIDEVEDDDEERNFIESFPESIEEARKEGDSPRSQDLFTSKLEEIWVERLNNYSVDRDQRESSSSSNDRAESLKNNKFYDNVSNVKDKQEHITLEELADSQNPRIPREIEVVDLLTPSPCYMSNSSSKKRRMASVYPEIIDLTMSPMFA